MATKKYLSTGAAQTLADSINKRIKTVFTMPSQGTSNLIIFYLGEDTSEAKQGTFYKWDSTKSVFVAIPNPLESEVNLKQNKILDTSITIDDVEYTTVESAISALNNKKVNNFGDSLTGNYTLTGTGGKTSNLTLTSSQGGKSNLILNASGGGESNLIIQYFPGGAGVNTTYSANGIIRNELSTGSTSTYSFPLGKKDGTILLSADVGVVNGIAELDTAGKVPSAQLPSYVDDVTEGYYYEGAFYTDSAHTDEITPESSKIYIDLTDNKTYRWSGSTYVSIASDLALGETEHTAYRGDRGKTAYDDSQTNKANIGDLTELATTEKTDLVSAINENYDNIALKFNKANVTSAFDSTLAYTAGSVVIHEDNFYQFDSDCEPGPWESADVSQITLVEYINSKEAQSLTSTQLEYLVSLITD